MKILVTSDNHLGYKEKDSIRGDDTFNTFEEIIQIGKREKVDLILQGGDLFDENRPSRNTYNKILKILKKYCLGDNNNNEMKIHSKIPLNIDDKKLNISLPILSIHGNHDDPTGLNSVSPLDVLHSSGLLNYFGKWTDYDKIIIDPILIVKGKFKIALYGLGHIKDRIIYRTFMKSNVKFNKPESDDWFNIFIVHQNRTPRVEEYLPVDLIDSFFDLVIFGHEHESLRIYNNKFDIIQCGSTVITNLSEGEAYDKNIYILNFEEENIIKKIKLKTTRPFLMDDIKIDQGDCEMIIKNKLEKMLINSKEMYNENMLPLVRLRIDIGKGISFNRNRINTYFDKRVANPGDIIKIMKKYEKKELVIKNVIERNGINEIYKILLESNQLSIFIIPRIIETLNDFIEKNNKDAWTNMINEEIINIIGNIDCESIILEDLENIIKETKNRIEKKEYGSIKEIKNKIEKKENGFIKENKNKIEKKENIVNKKLNKVENDCELSNKKKKPKIIKKLQNNNKDQIILQKVNCEFDNIDLLSQEFLFSEDKKKNDNIDLSSYDFTFLEDKREKIENDKIVEECQNYFLKNNNNKEEDSDNDLLDYTKYM